ncbi:hypothetical protein GF386_04965 [Candidatus Pacearchaeota archaeon]|nr:hypothetical protein [Candidatus Pacearchaeota archaeon]MBD3283464.1 hypothetical protein [Candidatus Pacearchaeota archaeon]
MKSQSAFVVTLIGGISSIAGGIGNLFTGFITYFYPEFFLEFNPGMAREISGVQFFSFMFAFVWLVVMGVLAVLASIKIMKGNNEDLRLGGLIAIIVGVLSFNLLTIAGGALAIGFSKKR